MAALVIIQIGTFTREVGSLWRLLVKLPPGVALVEVPEDLPSEVRSSLHARRHPYLRLMFGRYGCAPALAGCFAVSWEGFSLAVLRYLASTPLHTRTAPHTCAIRFRLLPFNPIIVSYSPGDTSSGIPLPAKSVLPFVLAHYSTFLAVVVLSSVRSRPL